MMKLLLLLSTLALASAKCPNDCNGHGTCNKYSACECYRNWMAADCSERVCYFGHAFVDTPQGDLNADGRTDVTTGAYQVILGSNQSFFSKTDTADSSVVTAGSYLGRDAVGAAKSSFQMQAEGSQLLVVEDDITEEYKLDVSDTYGFTQACADTYNTTGVDIQYTIAFEVTGLIPGVFVTLASAKSCAEGAAVGLIAADGDAAAKTASQVEGSTRIGTVRAATSNKAYLDITNLAADVIGNPKRLIDGTKTLACGNAETAVASLPKFFPDGAAGTEWSKMTLYCGGGVNCVDGTSTTGATTPNTANNSATHAIYGGGLAPTTTTASAGIADGVTTLNVAAASALTNLAANDYIKVGDEYLKVTGIDTNALTVTRGQLGTTAAAIANGATVTLSYGSRTNTFVCAITPAAYRVQWSNVREWEAYPTDHAHASSTLKSIWDEGHFYRECSNKGTCNRGSGQCECYAGYEGEGCSRQACANDCSGHGTCKRAIDRESTSLAWDAYKTQNCECDGGYTGPDCSLRICPSGDDPITRMNDRNEIQKFGVTVAANIKPSEDAAGSATEAFFALEYTTELGEKFTTRSIDFLAPTVSKDVENALESLPQNVIEDVETSLDTANGRYVSVTFLHNSGNIAPLGARYQWHIGAANSSDTQPSRNTAEGAFESQAATGFVLSTTQEGNKENTICSNRGLCDYSTGLCKCFSGFTDFDCSVQNALATA